MKNLLATLTVPALLIGGAAVASAQTDGGGGGGTDDDGTTESAEHRGHRARHGVFGRFVDALDLDRDAIRAAVEEGRTLAELADEQGVDIDAVIDDIVDDAQAKAEENPDSAFAERFDADRFRERLDELVDRELEPRPHHRHRGARVVGGAISDALGLEDGELREALADGKTIAEVADEQGVDIDAVIDQLVADAEARVAENPDSRFAERFDAEQFEERLTELVDREIDPDRHPHRHRGHRFGGGQPPAGSDDATASGVSA